MKIRRLAAHDSTLAICAIQRLKPAQTTSETVTKFLDRADHYFIAALEGYQPVGFALAHELQRIDRPETMLFLYEIGVDEAYRRQGVGTAMIRFLKDICRERDIFKMFVIAEADCEPALRLYGSAFGNTSQRAKSVVFTLQTNV